MAEPDPDWLEAAGQGRAPAPAGEAMPLLSVAGFEGPLDFLLEMVRRHRVDLGPLSIVALTDQLVAALEDSAHRVPLERRSTWLVAASDLVLLKARLLCPESPAVAEAAAAEASRRLDQLTELARMRAAADWLAAKPQLGLRVFARGPMERRARPQAELYVAFLEAPLAMLEGREGQPAHAPAYQPAPLKLWRVPDAIARVTALLDHQPDGLSLADCLPPIPAGAAKRQLRQRAALASTLVASLELARDATLNMDQDQDFGIIILRARTDHRIGQESAA
jgi:segregation and condensation protein A